MLHAQLHRRLLTLAAAAASALALASAGTARADVAQVTVVSPGGAGRTLALDALAGGEDVRERTYELRSAIGEATRTVTGFSLAALIEAAGADPFSFGYLEVQRPAGGSVLLGRDQALDPGAFADGPPVVYATAGGTGFLRPSAGAEDRNAADSFEAPQGLSLVLRRGSPLRVEAHASSVRTRPGRLVSFHATVAGAAAGAQPTFSWYFDDGHSVEGAAVRHRFARRGSYDVVVGVTTTGDETGASAVVTVQVGPPLAGPERRGGGANEDASAPDHGAATGSSHGPTSPRSSFRPLSGRKLDHPQRGSRRRGRAAGGRVAGELLNASAAPPPRPAPLVAARSGRLDDAPGAGAGLPGAAIGLLLTTGLLGAGALVEVRR